MSYPARVEFGPYAASRLSSISESAITQIAELTKRLRAEGRDIVSLSAGEPDFDTPAHILEAARQAMRDGDTKYPRTQGSLPLVGAIQEKFARENKLDVEIDDVLVSNGAKQVLFNAFLATLNPGDEVIIPAPYWTSYPDIVRLCGGVPVFIPCQADEAYRLTPEKLAAAIGLRSRWLLLNNPANPTGVVHDREQLQALFDIVRRTPNLLVMVDEIYEHLIYDGLDFASARVVAPDLSERLLIVNGVSKAYAMTGWRIGYGVGPKGLIRAMTLVQGQSTSGACSIAQAAAAAALSGPQELVEQRRKIYAHRRDVIIGALGAIPHLSCHRPSGAFYAMISFSNPLDSSKDVIDDVAISRTLLEKEHVAVVPGSAFGAAGDIRISYACSEENLRVAAGRIAEFMSARNMCDKAVEAGNVLG